MAEPTTFPEEHVRELVVYRRISGFAITSLAFAVSFAVCLVMATLWGLRDRSPLLLPAFVQALPVIGAALALTAMYLIRNSEGTLAGMKLAVWGWWLSVVFGLGYGAYYGATSLAVQKQAEDFALGWLNKVKDGKFGDAFMDTQDPANRQKLKSEALDQINIQFLMAMGMPKDGVLRPPLDVFRENPLVHLIEQGGAATQIVPLAVKSWDFKG